MGITVLSLFDGISCGQQALKELNIPVDNYFASEIEVSAMKIAHKNFPKTKFLGDVRYVKAKNLPKIDLLLAGSPCQGFSSNGKQLNFEDPRSKLFFEFVRILKEARAINPKVKFLLENVKMKKEWIKVIDDALGVESIHIDSGLLTAQRRNRLYWTNLPVTIPKQKGVRVRDILDQPFVDVEKGRKATDKNWKYNFNGGLNILDLDGKAPCLLTSSGSTYPLIATGFKTYRRATITEMERLQTLPDDYTKGIPLAQRVDALGNGWTVKIISHILKSLKTK